MGILLKICILKTVNIFFFCGTSVSGIFHFSKAIRVISIKVSKPHGRNHTETDIYLSNKNLDQAIITKTTKKQELH